MRISKKIRGTSFCLFGKNSKKVLFFGSKHSWDLNDPQMGLIKEIFDKFKPEVVILETSRRGEFNDEREAILKGGETGLVDYLAKKRKIEAIPGDPNEKSVAKKLLKKYTREEVVLYFILRVLNQYPKVKIKPEYSVVVTNEVNKWKFLIPNLSYDIFKKIFKKLMKKEFDEKSLGKYYDFFDPNKNLAVINSISRDDSSLRDNYTLKVLRKILRKFNRVFIMKGAGHTKFFRERIPKLLQRRNYLNYKRNLSENFKDRINQEENYAQDVS